MSLVWSITGLDSERAWKMREDLLKDGVSIDYILESICGIDSSRAWTMRNEFKVESTPDATSLARSFFGRSFTSPLTIGKNR